MADGIEEYAILVKSKNNIFGGYSDIPITSIDREYTKNRNSFLFKLN